MPSKQIAALIIFVVSLITETSCGTRRRRRNSCSPRNCIVTQWYSWSSCSVYMCGRLGARWRYRDIRTSAICGGTCPYHLMQSMACYGHRPVDCIVSSWSSWSPCSAAQCAIPGVQHRTRSILVTNSSCGGRVCPPNLQESKVCYGTKAVDCQYSAWSSWSVCSLLQCANSQISRRHVAKREQCGGKPCNVTALLNTRPCEPTFCVNQGTLLNGKCFCKPGYLGNCCQHKSKWSRIK